MDFMAVFSATFPGGKIEHFPKALGISDDHQRLLLQVPEDAEKTIEEFLEEYAKKHNSHVSQLKQWLIGGDTRIMVDERVSES